MENALHVSGVFPGSKNWVNFSNVLLLVVGSMALAFSLVFIVAYNWFEFGRLAKFALAESVILIAGLSYLRFHKQKLLTDVSLIVATIALGALLALYGQTYQTGADPWNLFFYWALLILPWALLSRSSWLWLIWFSLLLTSLILYSDLYTVTPKWLRKNIDDYLWVVPLFASASLIVWEFFSKSTTWLENPWARRVIGLILAFTIATLGCVSILEPPINMNAVIFFILWCVAAVVFYKKYKQDLFMIAGALFALAAFLLSIFGRLLNTLNLSFSTDILFTGIAVLCLGSSITFILKKIHSEFNHD